MSQYLTQVNGMPDKIEKHLLKAQREFMWGGAKSSPVQREMLVAPIEAGGKNLLDLKARNDAIQIMKLKTYLELDPEMRTTWGYIVDARLQNADVKSSNVDAKSYANMFLQTWRANQRKLPNTVRPMIKVAQKYGVSQSRLASHYQTEDRGLGGA
ncbi:hypothetical protein B0H12DRAFT_1025980 [Mycena haematopus]|nr:hypothetical protein B0H12DRAFT_1025980 [Mycena haematopus]